MVLIEIRTKEEICNSEISGYVNTFHALNHINLWGLKANKLR